MKGNNFCDFMFASLEDEPCQKIGVLFVEVLTPYSEGRQNRECQSVFPLKCILSP